MICGDLNAPTGCEKDFISDDGTGHLTLYQNYDADHPPLPRQNNDATTDSMGRSLIELCIGNQLRILNGDSFWRYTCYTTNGCSVWLTTQLCKNQYLTRSCISRSPISLQH